MRTTYHGTSGILSPHRDEWLQMVPDLGRTIFQWVAQHAAQAAGREFRTAASHMRTLGAAASRSDKQRATAWYLVTKIAQEIGKTKAPIALKLGKLPLPDPWLPFSVFGAWFAREADTVRTTDLLLSSAATKAPKKGAKGKKFPVFTRKKVSQALAAYRALRIPPTAAPEHPNRDPLARLHDAVCGAIAKLPAGQRITVKSALAAVDTKWPAIQADLSQDVVERVYLALGQLLVLRNDYSVWTHDLDFAVEPLLREVLLEATREHLGSMLKDPAGPLSGALISAVSDHVAFHLHSVLEIRATPPLPTQDDIRAAAHPLVVAHSNEIVQMLHAASLEAAIPLGEGLNKTASDGALAAVVGSGQYPGVASGTALPGIPWRSEDLEGLCNTLVAYANAAQPFTLKDVMDDPAIDLSRIVEQRFTARFGTPPTWAVAVPLTMYSQQTGPTLGALVSWPALVQQWNVGPQILRPEGNQLALVREVRARDEHAALMDARTISDHEASILWLASGSRAELNVLEHGLVRPATGGTATKVTYSQRSILQGPARLSPAQLQRVSHVATTLRQQSQPGQRREAVWAQLAAGLSFVKTALGAQYLHERVVYAWLAVEGVFGNFESETKPYEGAVPIGTRVAYRCASVLPPRKRWPGITYGRARWAVTDELQALYRLRCATVHEGASTPAVDDLVFGRWVETIMTAIQIVTESVFARGATSVEEVVAFYERRFPANQPVP